jgi:hypothetical protein
MPHAAIFLNSLQLSVLSWIADGCLPGIVEGYSHRITAKALETRGLIAIDGKGRTWKATITQRGLDELKNSVAPGEQVGSEAITLLQTVLDAGGPVTLDGRRDPVADARLLDEALKVPLRPFGKKLAYRNLGGWGSSTTEWFLDIHFPDLVDRAPVPLVGTTRKYHPVAAAYRDDRDNHRVSKDHLQRALHILHSLATEAERRGHGVALPSGVKLRPRGTRTDEVQGQIALVVGENVFGIALREIPGAGATRMPYQPDARLPRWQRSRQFTFNPTGRLELEITNWSSARRPSTFRDIRSVSLESRLADVLFEIEVRHLEANWEHDEAARKAAEKQANWQRAMTVAEAALHESRRVQHLRIQIARWKESTEMMRFIAAARTSHPDNDEFVRRAAAWLEWAEEYAMSIDPLEGALAMPIDRPFSPEELKPFLGGWDPYGPRA